MPDLTSQELKIDHQQFLGVIPQQIEDVSAWQAQFDPKTPLSSDKTKHEAVINNDRLSLYFQGLAAFRLTEGYHEGWVSLL